MKIKLDDILATFNDTRIHLVHAKTAYREATDAVDNAKAALLELQREQEVAHNRLRNAARAVHAAGERLREAIPGYVAGAADSVLKESSDD